MNKKNLKDRYTDTSQDLNIQIPSRLVERVESYASETGTTVTNVVIEALAIFLREQKRLDPWKFALLRFAYDKSAPFRLAPLRLTCAS